MSNAATAPPFNSQTAPEETIGTVVPHWVKSLKEAKKAAHSNDDRFVWIISKSSLADYIAREVAHRRFSKKLGQIVVLKTIRPPLLPALENGFTRVAFPAAALPKEELKSVLTALDRKDRFVGGTVDGPSKIITLWRGDLKPLVVPFDAFLPTANGIRPRFDLFAVADYGATLKFGDYEAAADAVLYEFDPEFRRRIKQRRFAEDDSLGASIQRLRMQRQLTRHDFEGIDPKTLARIENGQVRKPHAGTLSAIAEQLGVALEELGTF